MFYIVSFEKIEVSFIIEQNLKKMLTKSHLHVLTLINQRILTMFINSSNINKYLCSFIKPQNFIDKNAYEILHTVFIIRIT